MNAKPYDQRSQVGWCGASGLSLLPDGLTPLASSHETIANYIAGKGVTCDNPPPGYRRHGFADASLGVPAGVYPYWST